MKYVLRPAVCLIVASVAILVAACDRKSPSNDGGDQGGSSPIILRGGERLGWDQPAVSGTNPSSYGYIMYVDGAPTTLTNVSCTGTSAAGFTCSSLLPAMTAGLHNLTLVASAGGAMSTPSRSLSVSVSVATTVLEEATRQDKGIVQPPCSDRTTGPCYRSTELLRSLGVISTPVSAPNGRVLFVVDGRQIQAVSTASTVPNVLLHVESPAKILSIAVPRSGSDAGSVVWVASTDTRADETRTLTITRYRLVEDTLGEAAVIVSMGIPPVEPRVAIDDDSHIYIAMPSTTTSEASVWRLLPDGTTPRTQSTPQFAAGVPVPMAMAVAPNGQLWLSGMNDAGLWQLGRVDSVDVDARFQSVAPARDDSQSVESDITSFAFARGARAGEPESFVLAVAKGTLYRASVTDSRLGSMQSVPVSRGIAIEVAADDGGVYLVTGTLNDRSVFYSLFRLVP